MRPPANKARRGEMRASLHPVLDFVAHQLGWWACVLVARTEQASWAPIGLSGYLMMHLLLSRESRPTLLLLAAGSATLGLVLDSALMALQLMSFPHGAPVPLSPPWMMALWAALGLSLSSSLVWLLRVPLAAVALIGAVAGPLAYSGGAKLGLIAVAAPTGFLGVGLAWAIGLGLLVAFARTLRRAVLPVVDAKAEGGERC